MIFAMPFFKSASPKTTHLQGILHLLCKCLVVVDLLLLEGIKSVQLLEKLRGEVDHVDDRSCVFLGFGLDVRFSLAFVGSRSISGRKSVSGADVF